MGLTSLFGMGRGVPHCYSHLKSFNIFMTMMLREKQKEHKWKVYGQLVLLGFDVATFTPATYQRDRLSRSLKEI
jgi:hypothetical protein